MKQYNGNSTNFRIITLSNREFIYYIDSIYYIELMDVRGKVDLAWVNLPKDHACTPITSKRPYLKIVGDVPKRSGFDSILTKGYNMILRWMRKLKWNVTGQTY